MLRRVFDFFSGNRDIPITIEENKDLVYIETNNEKKLSEMHYNTSAAPERFYCKLTFNIMDIPVILDPAEHDHIVEFACLKALKRVAQNEIDSYTKEREHIVNPFTRSPIKKIEIATNLKVEIQRFVIDLSVQHLYQEKFGDTFDLSNTKLLSEFGISNAHIPKDFFSKYFNKEIFNFPVIINGKDRVEFSDLNKWWITHDNFPKNPCEEASLITSLVFDEELYKLIGFFITEKTLEKQIEKFEGKLMRGGITSHERLTKKLFAYEQVPSQFIGSNRSGRIMTDAVCIDKDYILDYSELKQYWDIHPDHKFKNPYTEKFIKTISYENELNEQINTYLNRLVTPTLKNMLLFPSHQNGISVAASPAASTHRIDL